MYGVTNIICNSEKNNLTTKPLLSPLSLINHLSYNVPTNIKKMTKIEDNNFNIPKMSEYDKIRTINYRVSQLKQMCKRYGQKLSGNKSVLQYRIYNYLRLSYSACKIQNMIKKNFIKHYNNLKGPAKFRRDLCVNDTDFFTMDDIKEIPHKLFISIMDDDDKKIYGFNVNSLHTLYCKNKEVKNPYNRKVLPAYIMTIIKKMITYSKFTGDEIILEKVEDDLTPLQRIDMRTLQIFQKMDMLGHYTELEWFTSLDKPKIIGFIRHISDIWYYRAQLSLDTKKSICPPRGDPFNMIPIGYNYSIVQYPITTLKRFALTIMEKMILYGVTEDDKYLGSSLVLCAVTLVSDRAAIALPGLYESVSVPTE